MLTFNAENHEYRNDGKLVPCVSNIIEFTKNFSIPLKDLDDDKKMRWWYSFWEKIKVKRDWGNNLHLYSAMYDLGTINPNRELWDKRMVNMVDAYQRFLDEKIFVDNRTRVVDIKSSEKPQWPTGVQIAGYLPAIKETIARGDVKFAKRKTPNGFIDMAVEAKVYSDSMVYAGTVDRIFGTDFSDLKNIPMIECCISENGTYKSMEYPFAEYYNLFLCCMTVFNRKNGGR